ncbi:MAG: tetratricopeptide repeat protein, partial [Gemmataceae bacterium]|nr:tetratricopeptide repeat protein [Gemmataceae bacterium]
PAAATLLAVVALAAAGGAAGLLWHNARLREAADRERGQAGRADEKTRWARRAVNDMYTRLAEEWLADAHLSEVQREFLTRALEFYEESVRDAGAVEDRLEVARTYRRMAHLRGGLSRNAEALADLRVAARIAAEFPGSDECRLESARAAVDLGRLLTIMDQTAEGRTELRRAVPLIEGLHRARPDDPEYRADLANALFLSAVSPREPGQPDRGMEELARAREQAAWLVAHRPGTVRYEELLVRVNSALGGRLVDAGQTADGEHCLLEARDRLQGLMTKAPTRPVLRRRLATLLEHLADLRSGRGTTGRPSGWPVRRSNSGAGSTTSTRTGPPTGKRWPRHKPSTGAP